MCVRGQGPDRPDPHLATGEGTCHEHSVPREGREGTMRASGRVAERTKAAVLKAARGASPSRVRIPALPRWGVPNREGPRIPKVPDGSESWESRVFRGMSWSGDLSPALARGHGQ